MRCPLCNTANLMGLEDCQGCGFPLCGMDGPVPLDRVEGSVMFDAVATLKPRVCLTVSSRSSLYEALQSMTASHVGAVLVLGDCGELKGILTERDLLMRVPLGTPLADWPVTAVMTPQPEVVQPQDPLAFALGKMAAGGYRHIPVVDAGGPIGMVSIRDALSHMLRLCQDV